MKLLIVTQVVDSEHSNLGFFHGWIEEFARQCESVHVVCLQEGRYILPPNVTVYSLGKEKRKSRIVQLLRFYAYITGLKKDYDAVFVHMNPEYVVLAGPLWRLWGKKVGLWYVHKSVTLRLRIAVIFANLIFTASPESFRLKSKKLQVLGHGIDTEHFVLTSRSASPMLRLLSIGRIAASKGHIEILRALDVLHVRKVAFTFTIVGGPLTSSEQAYEEELKREIEKRPYAARVRFVGPLPNSKLPEVLRDTDVLVNISTTGGYDKVVLEALASGVPAISSSAPFRRLLEPHGLFIKDIIPESVTSTIQRAHMMDITELSEKVRSDHSLNRLVAAILHTYETLLHR